jgi:TetR/AcrR family transcriptional regulator, transcriptional repressor for nem operon
MDARGALLQAGQVLSQTDEAPDAARLEQAAGLEMDALDRVFGSLPQYLAALQDDLLQRLRHRVLEAALAQPSGRERIYAGTLTYLDGYLDEQPLRRWLVNARESLPPVADGIRRQNRTYALVLRSEFEGMRWPFAHAAARLFIAMVMEAAMAEHESGARRADMRAALREFLESF